MVFIVVIAKDFIYLLYNQLILPTMNNISNVNTARSINRISPIIEENIENLKELLDKPQSESQYNALTLYLQEETDRLLWLHSDKDWSLTTYSNIEVIIRATNRTSAINEFNKKYMSTTMVLDLGSVHLKNLNNILHD